MNVPNIDKELLKKVANIKEDDGTAINIRKNGKLLTRKITENVTIKTKEDGSGIDIFIKENAPTSFVYIPVIVTESGLEDVVYNDFHIGKNAKAVIVAGCAIHNNKDKKTSHNGIHRFYGEENSKIKYIEKHYGEGKGQGHKILDPVTEIYLEKGSKLEMDTTQIEGVDKTKRITKAILKDDSTLIISEKIMTNSKQKAETIFDVELKGENSSCHVVSRSVATDNSKQVFRSKVFGNSKCYGHVECDAIIKDNANVIAVPKISAKHVDANLIHEATIGKIAGEQLIKLMSLGLTEKEAEKQIIDGFLK
jgi:ABC-type transport system involved in Fe-S cluster assembly, permease component